MVWLSRCGRRNGAEIPITLPSATLLPLTWQSEAQHDGNVVWVARSTGRAERVAPSTTMFGSASPRLIGGAMNQLQRPSLVADDAVSPARRGASRCRRFEKSTRRISRQSAP